MMGSHDHKSEAFSLLKAVTSTPLVFLFVKTDIEFSYAK